MSIIINTIKINVFYDCMSSVATAWSTWLIFSLFYAYQFVERIVPNVVLEDIVAKYHIDANQMGQFAGIYYIGYVTMHIPLGIILQHFSAKKVIPICIILAVIGFTPLVHSDSFKITYYGRFLIGLGSAGSTVGAFRLLRSGFGEKRFPKVLGWMVTVGLLGAIFGTGPLSKFVLLNGWVETLNYIIIFGLVLALCSYLIIPDTYSNNKITLQVVKDDFAYLFLNKKIIVVGILGGCMIGPLEGFTDMWSNKYLVTVFKISNENAGNITQLVYIGMSIGLTMMGYLFEKIKSYYILLLMSSVLMLTSFSSIILSLSQNIVVLKFLYFTMGFSCAYQVLIIGKSISMARGQHSTFISAITNMNMMGFGYLIHVGIGKLLNYLSDGSRLNEAGSKIYTASNLNNALLIIPLCLIIAIIGFTFLMLIEKRNKKIIT